jgi:hypothetical protein
MNRKMKKTDVVRFPAIVIDDDHKIFFPSLEETPRVGILTFSKESTIEGFMNILDSTGTSFVLTGFMSRYSTLVYFLGDIRTLKSKINGVSVQPSSFRSFNQIK